MSVYVFYYISRIIASRLYSLFPHVCPCNTQYVATHREYSATTISQSLISATTVSLQWTAFLKIWILLERPPYIYMIYTLLLLIMLLNNVYKSVFAEYYNVTAKLTFGFLNIHRDELVSIFLFDRWLKFTCYLIMNSHVMAKNLFNKSQ